MEKVLFKDLVDGDVFLHVLSGEILVKDTKMAIGSSLANSRGILTVFAGVKDVPGMVYDDEECVLLNVVEKPKTT